jgi:deazaflavin-dependent oxidoreductase (nitroreductase family)
VRKGEDRLAYANSRRLVCVGSVLIAKHKHEIIQAMKHRVVHLLQKYVMNPPIKAMLSLGVAPPGYAFLETTGRRTGATRRTPVGDGLEGGTFWIVAEHGRRAGYVRNIEADPRVRVKVRRGRRHLWLSGTAHVLDDDDPRERQRLLGRGHALRRLNALAVRGMGTQLLTVRIDLDPRRQG